jgi:hypothetical protein
MVLLEDQHWSQSHGHLTRATDVDTMSLGFLEDLITARCVPGDESTLALSSQILDILRILFREAR